MENLYETDFYRWAQQQTELLKAHRLGDLDRQYLAQELRLLAQEYEKELQKRFSVLLTDLLVWQFEYDFRSYPQKCRIRTQRDNIKALLSEHPSLGNIIPRVFSTAYEEAVYEAAIRTSHWFTDFHTGLWTVEDVLDEDFWPERWPEHAKEDDLDNLRKQPWFQQEILRALDERGLLTPPPPTKKAL